MIQEYKEKYKNLIAEFLSQLPKDVPSGIPCPMIPCVGDLYEASKYKIAFFGMETRGWGDLLELQDKSGPNAIFDDLTEDFKELSFVDWTNNFHTSFWDYVFTFLSKFYKIQNSYAFQNNES
jgi:hypothetical protein